MSRGADDLTSAGAASWAEALRRDEVLRLFAESDNPVSQSKAAPLLPMCVIPLQGNAR